MSGLDQNFAERNNYLALKGMQVMSDEFTTSGERGLSSTLCLADDDLAQSVPLIKDKHLVLVISPKLGPSLVERAFILAASGRFAKVSEIDKALRQEGHEAVTQHLMSTSLRGALRALIRAGAAETDNAALSSNLTTEGRH